MRVYDEEEIGRILKRAGELSRIESPDPTVGLTLDEVKELGTEFGIDPALIARAAMESGRDGLREDEFNIFGGPMSVSREIVLEMEVDDAEWEEMLVHIREEFADPGTVSVRNGTYEWTGQDKKSKAHVTVRHQDERSYLSVFWSSESLAVVPFIPVFAGVPFTILAVFEGLGLTGAMGVMTWLLLTFAIFMVSRSIAVTIKKRRARQIEKLISRLERTSERTERRTTIVQAPTVIDHGVVRIVEKQKVDLPPSEEEETDPPDDSGRSRRRGRSR